MREIFSCGNVVVAHLEATEEEKQFANRVKEAIHEVMLPLVKEHSKQIGRSTKIVGVQACMGAVIAIHEIYNALFTTNGVASEVAQEIADEMGDKFIAAMNEAMVRAQEVVVGNN